jgi:4-amino-4-deoxy-L-arabinose transferase-like glycosyltransferase
VGLLGVCYERGVLITSRFAHLRKPWVGYVLLALALAVPAFWNLGGGELHEWDEGLALRHAKNALEFGRWLTPTSNTGGFSPAFTKPPYLIWQTALGLTTFGWSALGARSGTALALVFTGVVCAALGRQLGLNRWLGSAWAFAVVLSGGALRWAREVNIEIPLVMFSVLALYCYSRALTENATTTDHVPPAGTVRGTRRLHLWAVAAGAALCGAFLTKQMVCGLPAVAIVLAELIAFRRAAWKTSAVRLGITGALPTLMALAWFLQANAQSKGRVVRSMVDFTIVKRFSGLSGGQHFNYLNRVSIHLTDSLSPFPWELGLLGVALLWYRIGSRRPAALTLVTLYGLCGIAVFDMGSRSILPWYTWSIAVPLMLGIAHLLAQVIDYSVALVTRAFSEDPTAGALAAPSFEVALGGAAIVLATSNAWELQGSRLSLMLTLVVAAVAGISVWKARLGARVRGVIVSTALVGPALLFLYTLTLRPAYGADPGPLFALMEPLAGVKRVAVASDLTSARQTNVYNALFGPGASVVRRAPWQSGPKEAYQAYVQRLQLPSEFTPAKGVSLYRSQGVVAWKGKLNSAPFNDKAMGELLKQGPLTFEAEEGTSTHPGTFARYEGQRVRYLGGLNSDRYRAKATSMFRIETPALPAGAYEIAIHLGSRCERRRKGPVGEVRSSFGDASHTLTLPCSDKDLHPVIERLTSRSARPLKVDVRFLTGQLWVDKIVVKKK